MIRVFLTGGSGMVGSNLIETAPSDVEVIAPRRHDVDVTDPVAVRRAIEGSSADFVIHAAGRVGGIAANMADPASFLAENVRMGLAVLEAAKVIGIPCINLASSCIYPPEAINPLTEDMVLTGGIEPTNEAYALAKLSVLRMGQYINRGDGQQQIKSLIPCNLYGRYDHFDRLAGHLIPAAVLKVHQAKVGGGEVEIWGDGSARREFLYASDAAHMIWYAVDQFSELPDVMNIGLGFDYSVLEYYQAAADVVGWAGQFAFDFTKPVGMKRKLVDISHQQRLAFPAPSGLRQGLEKTYRFFLERNNL